VSEGARAVASAVARMGILELSSGRLYPGEEVRAGLRAVTRDGAGWASPQTIIARADLGPALLTLAVHVRAGAPAVHRLQDAATLLSTDSAVRAWSQPLARAALEAGAPQTRQLLEDFLTNRLVPVRREHLGPVMTAATNPAASHDRVAARFEGVPFDTRTAGLTPQQRPAQSTRRPAPSRHQPTGRRFRLRATGCPARS